MGQFYRILIAICAVFALAGCAGPSAIESQSKQKDTRLARMYFLREQGVLGALGGTAPAAEIKVDGKTVGSVTNGSYIFVDRSPGPYQLSVQSALTLAFETEVQVEAGKAYYFILTSAYPRRGLPDRTF